MFQKCQEEKFIPILGAFQPPTSKGWPVLDSIGLINQSVLRNDSLQEGYWEVVENLRRRKAHSIAPFSY